MLATIENLKTHYREGLVVFSPTTGEEYSANPEDYFWALPSFTLKDCEGNEMFLGTFVRTFVEISE